MLNFKDKRKYSMTKQPINIGCLKRNKNQIGLGFDHNTEREKTMYPPFETTFHYPKF